MSKTITRQSEDFSRWYTDVVQKAELADYSPVKGCMVICPYGYSIWESIQRELDGRIKATGCRNAYFPLFIPESFINKEKSHLEGFSPECAVVTHAGGEELQEKLVVRPTSETIIYYMFSKWVKSYRDLPLLINQWANVVRWEMRTRLFLRTSEFLWQEGHTAHATYEEAEARTLQMLDEYASFAENFLAIPVIKGVKSDHERFAGAHRTYTIEALMRDKKCLQAGTSHNLGQNFSRPFEITFLDNEGKTQYAWQTSWGVSTRLIGALVMVHGDDRGLILPPAVAPIQVVMVPIWKNDGQKEEIIRMLGGLTTDIKNAGLRVEQDLRENVTPGFKFNDWEMRGVPLRVECGPKDLEEKTVVLCRRDTGTKEKIPLADLTGKCVELMPVIQNSLLERARLFLKENITEVNNKEELAAVLEDKGGLVSAHWCHGHSCEDIIKQETKATLRCIPCDAPTEMGSCVICGQPSEKRVLFARSY
ncbi:MAG: proline--tRNA ligase [Candidatus Wallbacteria bacterium]|nr:proline--tRNA ligase [Candidatus Wallbacteria bacterium]